MKQIQNRTICGAMSCCTVNDEPVQTTYKGKIITFCEDECKEEFLEDPIKFLTSNHVDIEIREKESLLPPN